MRSDALGGYWFVTSYEGVREVFTNPSIFSSRYLTIPPQPLVLIPESVDPPDQVASRHLFAPLFSPAQAKSVEQGTRATGRDLAVAFAKNGGGDCVERLAVPLPCTVFLRMLGLPLADLERLLVWKDAVMRDMIADDPERAEHARTVILPEMMGYFATAVDERRAMAEPPDDVLTGMLAGKLDLDNTRPLTDDEVLNALLLFVVAGLDTVTAMLSLTIETLARRPDLRMQLVEDPSVVSSATEEFLRYWSLATNCRQANVDHTLLGAGIKAGDMVAVCTPAASRDPAEFSNPDVLDLRRQDNRHLAFGAGPHRCLGSHLARMEMIVALEEIHKAMPNYELAPNSKPTHHFGGVMGCDSLELVVTTGT